MVSLHKTKGLEATDNKWSHSYNNYVHAAFIFWESYKLTDWLQLQIDWLTDCGYKLTDWPTAVTNWLTDCSYKLTDCSEMTHSEQP
jgi:hypothetical protein